MALGQIAGEYKARAGTLTLSYLNSTMSWDGLRTILAQAATGADLVDVDAIVQPDRDDAVVDFFADPYLLEPVNPGDDPADPETVKQPTPAGREVPFLGACLHRWFALCPAGPVTPGQGSGEVLWPLLCGWASTVVHALAAGPRSVAEVQAAIGVLPLEAVEADIRLLADAGLIRPVPAPGGGGEERFEPTEWLRHAVAPLAVAARLELSHPREDTAPIAAADVEAALQLALPLLRMRSGPSGGCSLAVGLDEGVLGSPAGVTATIEESRPVACEPGLDPRADARVEGHTGRWLDAVIDGEARGLRGDGDWRLPRDILGGLHRALFGGQARSSRSRPT
jgi:hypothetical protein